MHKFTKESLSSLSGKGRDSAKAERAFRNKVMILMKMNSESKSSILTWNMNESINLIDEFLELIQQMNHRPIKTSVLKKVIMILEGNVDFDNLRQNGIIQKISSKIYEICLYESEIDLMILFGKILYYLSREKENLCQFHHRYQKIIEVLLETNNAEANGVGIDILSNIVKNNANIKIDFSSNMVKNIESHFMQENDWKLFIKIMKNQKESINFISTNALKKVIEYEREYNFLLDNLHYNHQIAFDIDLFETFINSFQYIEEDTENSKAFFASLCNFIQINEETIKTIITNTSLMEKLSEEMNKEKSNYVSMICAYITICSSISFNTDVIIKMLRKWNHEIEGNTELRTCIKTLIYKLKGM